MTEKEKMIGGAIYYANCEELLKERERAKNLCYEYNNLKQKTKYLRLRIHGKQEKKIISSFQ